MRPALIAALLALVACGGSDPKEAESWTLAAVKWDGVYACRPVGQCYGSSDGGITKLCPFACPAGSPDLSSGCAPHDEPLNPSCMDDDLSSVAPGLTQLCTFSCPGH